MFVMGATVAHDVVRDGEDVVPDRDDGLLVAARPLEAMISGLKRGPVTAGRGEAGLHERAA
jgi:hypothetical protein